MINLAASTFNINSFKIQVNFWDRRWMHLDKKLISTTYEVTTYKAVIYSHED